VAGATCGNRLNQPATRTNRRRQNTPFRSFYWLLLKHEQSTATTNIKTQNLPNPSPNGQNTHEKPFFLGNNPHVASMRQQHMFMSGDSALFMFTFP
jgi:hypothetical protein